jgi:hypothetical protein
VAASPGVSPGTRIGPPARPVLAILAHDRRALIRVRRSKLLRRRLHFAFDWLLDFVMFAGLIRSWNLWLS